MGVGGFDDELKTIFEQAFFPRLFPDILGRILSFLFNMMLELNQLINVHIVGPKYTRGILLYGPSGVGKTFVAHQIGKMWNSREPKVVNGHDLFAKHVRDAEADIRKLFIEAEEEEKQVIFHLKLSFSFLIIYFPYLL